MEQLLFTVANLDGFHGSVMHVMEWGSYYSKLTVADYLSLIKGLPETSFLCGKKDSDFAKDEKAFKVSVCYIFAQQEILDIFHEKGIETFSIFEIKDIWKELNFDIVFSYHFPIIGFLLQQEIQIKKLVLGSLSSFESLEFYPDVWPLASMLTTVSEEAKLAHVERFGIPVEKIFVVENLAPDEYLTKGETLCGEQNHHKMPSGTSAVPKKISIVSNHIPEELLGLQELLDDSQVDLIGQGQTKCFQITPDILGQYDLVITIGKTTVYSLSLGIPVYEYDYFGGNGYVTVENYTYEKSHNFTGRPQKRKLTTEEVANEIILGYSNALKNSDELRARVEEDLRLSKRLNLLLIQIINSREFNLSFLNRYETSLSLSHSECFCRWMFNLKNHAKYLNGEIIRLNTECNRIKIESDTFKETAENITEELRKIKESKRWKMACRLAKCKSLITLSFLRGKS